uniref:DNA-directed RNA polymerase n=1 Tax=viral metagenome TaxID=1070528 RepID=A0A6C0HWQ3_9ZZZZ
MSDFGDEFDDADSISSSEEDDEYVVEDPHIGGAIDDADIDADADIDVDAVDDDMDGEGVEGVEEDADDDIAAAALGGVDDIAAGNESDSDSDEEESYLQKFNAEVNKNYILDFHPECMINNYDEIAAMTNVVRDNNNNVIDDLHRTIPYLTKYEKARVLGQRAKQINSGAKVFVKVPDNVIDGYLIAELELAQKRVPFIIRRPISGGGCEYWNLKDLEIIGF